MPRILLASLVVAAACGGGTPPAEPPAPVAPPVAVPVDAAPPDAGIPDALADAPAWVFRYSTAERSETWVLRHHGDAALVVVQSAQGVTRYLGTARDGASLAIEASTRTAKLTLDCKRAKRPLSTACNDAKARPVDVLDCYHPDFAAPMPFGPAPGVEYAVDATCNGYRLATPRDLPSAR